MVRKRLYIMYLVLFDFSVAEKVSNGVHVIFSENKLVVKMHYKCIGILPPSHDSRRPNSSHRTELTLDTLVNIKMAIKMIHYYEK